MTGPVTTEARVEGLRTAHLAAIDACLRASETTGEVPQGLRLREREAAAALISTLLAALQQVTAERDEARAKLRSACLDALAAQDQAVENDERARTAEASLATATSELAWLRAEGEAKDRALLLLLPFVDYAAGEGLAFVETEDGEHPEMDAADIMGFAAQALGLELGSDAYLALLPAGYDAIRAARAATAREGA